MGNGIGNFFPSVKVQYLMDIHEEIQSYSHEYNACEATIKARAI